MGILFMQIERMLIDNLRIVQSADLRLGEGMNVFIGPNGSGKTSLLEAAHLLSYGRSFRAGMRDVLVRRGAQSVRVFAEVRGVSGRQQRLGLERAGSGWRGRIDGTEVEQLSALYRLCPVCCFEPGSHELISGSADGRRAFLDWGVFHVERDFLTAWRRYQRALRQRNALLKESAPDEWFVPWELEMAGAAAEIAHMRENHLRSLRLCLRESASALLPEFSGVRLEFSSGWKQDDPQSTEDIAKRLAAERAGDRERGFTRRGPHRADWGLSFEEVPRREFLSRGQEKLCALSMVLAQLSTLQTNSGEWPVLLLDDLSSELDRLHQERALGWLGQRPLQVLLTGVDLAAAVESQERPYALFHVEQGRVTAQD